MGLKRFGFEIMMNSDLNHSCIKESKMDQDLIHCCLISPKEEARGGGAHVVVRLIDVVSDWSEEKLDDIPTARKMSQRL